MILIRYKSLSDRTIGKLIIGDYTFETIEREGPDSVIKNSKRIPKGVYKINDQFKPNRIDIEGVPGRSGVQLHSGNVPTDSTGCIIVVSSKQLGLRSRESIAFIRNLREKYIEVVNAF